MIISILGDGKADYQKFYFERESFFMLHFILDAVKTIFNSFQCFLSRRHTVLKASY